MEHTQSWAGNNSVLHMDDIFWKTLRDWILNKYRENKKDVTGKRIFHACPNYARMKYSCEKNSTVQGERKVQFGGVDKELAQTSLAKQQLLGCKKMDMANVLHLLEAP